jgi:ketosteroid isomerase-like protein
MFSPGPHFETLEGRTMTESEVTPADVDELIKLMREAASAYIGGEMRRYFELMNHADDFTLMDPFGGDTTRETAVTDERLAALRDFFQSGSATLEVVQTYWSGHLAVLVVVERQHGVVGHLPEQDWSLRATLVFRHEGSRWRLVHRHADPLVHPITFDQLAELTRG